MEDVRDLTDEALLEQRDLVLCEAKEWRRVDDETPVDDENHETPRTPEFEAWRDEITAKIRAVRQEMKRRNLVS